MSTASKQPPSSRRRRRVDAMLVLAVLLGGVALTAARWPQHHTPTAAEQASALAALAAAHTAHQPDVAHGRRVFLRDCAFCHGPRGQGTAIGPELTDVGTAAVDFQLTTGRMPLTSDQDQPEPGPPAYPPSVIRDIVAYAGTFTTGPRVPVMAPGDVRFGRTLFLENCAPCHSSSGTGMVLPAGAFAPALFDSTPTQVGEAIRTGPGPMPPFPETQLDRSEMQDIATYVQRLGNDQDIGGAPIDFLGPIGEGIVAWLIPIPLLVLIIRLLGRKAP